MRKTTKFLLSICLLVFGIGTIEAQGLKAFKLPNGLSVFIYEEPEASDVYGMVAFNVGAKEDPENLTGLAHYLEHVLFKGTQKIGAIDWEKEAPLYEQIIAKYDERAKSEDPVRKAALNKEINALTVEAAKYGLTNEFAALTEGMAGTNLNAFTSYDMTAYHNTFPVSEIYKWLDLNSERLINPVFRAFQTELETVYEEFNRAENNPSRQSSQFLLTSLFPGHPYSRPVLGYPQHLKNPQLSGLIDFYNTWYVPENAALILVGNVNTKEVLPVIREKFGRLPKKASPERSSFPNLSIKGRKQISEKVGNYPQVILAFDGVTHSSEDAIALEVCLSILSNSSRTGLLDKLSIDGDVMAAYASSISFREQGRIALVGVPYYDVNQRRYNSHKSVEKLLLSEVAKVRKGDFEDWLIESIKNRMIRHYDLSMESSQSKAYELMNVFIYNQDPTAFLNYKEIVMSLTSDKIKEVAKKYLTEDYLVMNLTAGKPSKKEKLKKPDYDPLVAPQGVESEYAQLLKLTPIKYIAPKYADFDDVQVRQVNDKSKLFYTKNKENEIFSLILRYGIGEDKMPTLPLAASLMNNAGIMGQMKAQEVKKEFSNLGTTCSYRVSGSYLTVVMEGLEVNLEASCNLLTRQILFPDLDEKQFNNLKGSVYQTRMIEKNDAGSISSALNSYLLYKEKSGYIDRPSFISMFDKSIGQLTGDFQRATDYEAQIHYSGAADFETVYDILSKNLPLKAGEKVSTSPEVKDRVTYGENTIYFIGNRDVAQSSIYFFIEGDDYDKKDDVVKQAFNTYFSGGFNGLVMKEIREYRSMAYTSYGALVTPPIKDKKDYFIGYIGTQSDKVEAALEVYTNLLKDMPLHPERITNIKSYMKGVANTSEPDFRDLSLEIEGWKMKGYTQDPSKEHISNIDALTFDDIVKYYNEKIKGRPLAIAIIGDPRDINVKELEKYGKVVKIAPDKLFSKE